ncbi:MAG: hypothetical protein ACXADH_18510, partial [Candidatus Kariarchaeaceae archaeon]
MAYNCPGGCTRVNYWSNPNKIYQGFSMGVGGTGPNAADNRKSLNNTAYTCANFRQSNSSPGTPIPIAPDGRIFSNPPNYRWGEVFGAKNYKLLVYSVQSQSYIINEDFKENEVCS